MTRDTEAATGFTVRTTSLIDGLIEARRRHGGQKIIIEDQDRKPLTYDGMVVGMFALSRLLSRHVGSDTRLGMMLPTSVGGSLTFWALHAMGRVPVMINFTAGLTNVRAALKTAGVRTIITSRRFIEVGKMEDLIDGLCDVVRFIYLDDIRKELSLTDKAFAVVASKLPHLFARRTKPDDIGVILFTSGSFGAPRGVVLTQANLVANTRQVQHHIHLKPEWRLFNPMPIFHSLGLTGGVVLPPLTGLYCFQYPSPLHGKQIPPLIKATRATLLFSTDTFLNQYARQADVEDFSTLSLIVCGAEKVREDTHKLFVEQLPDLNIVEGYGVTETSPVLALNDPEDNRIGSVGKPLPGMELRLEPVDGIAEGGRLFVRGPNIMAGYLNPEDPSRIDPPSDGWHDTGDIVTLTDDGHIRILGRAKRFAKIAGEMVSLTAVEQLAEGLWPQSRHAVVAITDTKKGERLVLFTDRTDADTSALGDWARSQGAPALAVPRRIVQVEAIPVLGSGKTDYVALQKLAEAEAREAA